MKLLYVITVAVFVFASAFIFFSDKENIFFKHIPANEDPVKVSKSDAVKSKVAEKPAGKKAVTHKKEKTIPFYLDLQSNMELVPGPVLSAIKTVDKATAEPGEILTYTVTISNTGTEAATSLGFSDDIDVNTTLEENSLQTSPIAANDQYSSLGNVGIVVPALNGILANDYLGTNPAAILTAVVDAPTTGGGTISIAADGSFTYTPAAGYTGDDTYLYSLSNDAGSDNGTITITVANITWFINNNYAGAVADGRLATPFKSISDFQAVNDGVGLHPGDNHIIFVYESATSYTGNLTLRNGQKLIGQDATTTLPTITGFTTPLYSSPALPVLNSANATLVTLNGTAASTPVINLNGGVSGNYTIRGLSVGDKPNDATSAGIAGTSFGTLNVSEASIFGTGQALLLNSGTLNGIFASVSSTSGTNGISLTTISGTLTINGGSLAGNGTGVNLNGGIASVTYNGTISNSSTLLVNIQNKTGGTVDFNGLISSGAGARGISLTTNTGTTIRFDGGLTLNTGANNAFSASGGGTLNITQDNTAIINTIVTTTGIGLQIANTTIGANGASFRSIAVNGASKGISLNTTGAGAFNITGQGTTATSGGTIQNISVRGIELISAQNISLNNIQLTNANTTDGGGAGVCDEINNIGCNAALYIKDVTTIGLTQVNITNTVEQGMNMNNVNGLTISNCTIQGNGNETEEGALKIRNLLGTSSISNSIFKNSAYRISHIINTTGNAHLTVSNSSFINEASNLSLIKQDCFEMRTQSTATATLLINNSVFKRAGTKGIQVFAENTSTMNMAITGSSIDKEGQLMAGVEVGSDQTAVMNVNVDNNTLITGDREVPLNVYSGATSTMQSTARNNVIQGGNNPNLNAFATLRGYADQSSNSKILFTNNTITQTDLQGIQVATAGSLAGGSISGQVANNAVNTQNVAGNLTLSGIEVSSFSGGVGANNNCSYVNGNNVTMLAGTRHFRVAAASATSVIQLQGPASASTAELWNSNLNLPTSPPAVISVAQVAGSTITNGGVAPCPLPSNTTLPTAIAKITPLEEVGSLSSETGFNAKAVEPVGQELIKSPVPQQENKQTLLNIKSEPQITTSVNELLSGENVSVSGITLPENESLIIKFQVTVNDPFPDNVCDVSNQGSISGTNFTTLLTDNDADVNNGINPTVTVIPVAPAITSCQSNINVNTDPGLCTSSQEFSIVFSGCPLPTVTYTIKNTVTTITSPYAFPAGITTVVATATNGVGTDATCEFIVTVNSPVPVISSVSVPANSWYVAGQNLDFTVNFDAAVTVNTGGGTPYIPLTIGAESRNAGYISGSGTSALVFRYTVANTDYDNDGISAGASINANGGTIQNACNTNANLTLNNVGSTTGVLVDGIVPTVTVNQASGQADPTSNTTIDFTAVFSEPVTGFVSADIIPGGTAGATTALVTETAPNNGTTFNIAISGMTGDGTVIVTINAGVAEDAAGNTNAASTSTDNTVNYVADAPPLVLSINRHDPLTAFTNADAVTFRVTFSEDVTGVDASDFSLTTTSTATGSVASVTPVDGATYDVLVNSVTGDGTLRLDLKASGTGIKDDADQDITSGFTTGQEYTIDNTTPSLTTVTIASNNTNPALAKPGDLVTVLFTSSESINTPTATIATQTAVITSLGGNNYKAEYTMTSSEAEGIIPFSISFTDLAGNAGTPVTTTTNASSVTFDKTAPVVSSINRQDPLNQATTSITLTYRVTFSETVTGVGTTDFSLVSSSAAGESITSITPISGSVYDVNVSVSIFAGATLRLDLNATGTGIKDLAGNDISGGFSDGETYILGVPASISGCPTTDVPFNTSAGVCYATITRSALLNSITIEGTPAPVVTVMVGNTEITTSYDFPLGPTEVTISASNGIGEGATCTYNVMVIDNVAPVVSNLSASPNVLWPPNRKMRDVSLTYNISENCGCDPVVTITSNEPENGTGDGDKGPDWEVVENSVSQTGALIRLRAEKGNKSIARVYTIKVSCTDGSGNTDDDETQVRIAHNIVTPVSGTSFKIGSTVNFAGEFWDIAGNKHTGTWLIDESTTAKGTVTEPSGNKNGKLTGSYKFAFAGVYKLQMNLTDQDKLTSYANTNDDMEAIVVIYDPNGGYAHGGGYFNSPPGALISDPLASGKVSYGFTANYFKTATYPKGETQFEFKVGEFEFNALNFEYLVVDGAKAQFKGTGKITGNQSGISFIMTVIDGQLDGTGIDKIRMKIYNKNTGFVYYDNQPDLGDADNPSHPVGGQSTIVIGGSDSNTGGGGGGGKPKRSLATIVVTQEEATLQATVHPNPSRSDFRLKITSSNKTDMITMQVFDSFGRPLEVKRVNAGETILFGDAYRPGSYFVRLVQAGKHKEIKLIKLAD